MQRQTRIVHTKAKGDGGRGRLGNTAAAMPAVAAFTICQACTTAIMFALPGRGREGTHDRGFLFVAAKIMLHAASTGANAPFGYLVDQDQRITKSS